MGASVGQNGQNISAGDYVKIPYSAISGATAGNQASYIGVCLVAGGNNISGVYLTSAGTLTSFSNIAANQCLQLGQAAGPANAGAVVGQ